MAGKLWKLASAMTLPLALLSIVQTGLSAGGAGGAGGATPAASDAAGVVYPITSFLDWLQSPLDNVTDPAVGEYALGQILSQAQASVLTQFPGQLDPSSLLGPNGPAAAEAFSEEMAADLIHLRPVVATDNVTNLANPDFLPDFDHNGTYGDPGDSVAMSDEPNGTGYFLYPCLADDGTVTYQTTTGTCAAPGTAGDSYRNGLAQSETVVDSRGLSLSATLWLPAAALKTGCPTANPNAAPCAAPQGLAPRATLNHGKGLPAVVISDGIASDQSSYFWLAMTLARDGYIVVTYDPAGQGDSEGSVANLLTPAVPDCEFGGACRDLQDIVHWLVGEPIPTAVDLAAANPIVATSSSTAASTAGLSPTNPSIENPAYRPAGNNAPDPASGIIDQTKLAIAGHSMGALSLLNYLWYQGRGATGIDGTTLPPIATGIALSGAAPTSAVVPIQFQTSDFDGSTTLIGPALGGIDLGIGSNGIGYADMKPLYDSLRTSGPGDSPLSLIVMEGGVHTDFVDTPFITRTPWSLAVSSHYATEWLGCFLSSTIGDCFGAISPVAHLSSSFASEASPGGPLPRPSDCITVPTTASLNDAPSDLAGALGGNPPYGCTK
jgi:hypothetical protein